MGKRYNTTLIMKRMLSHNEKEIADLLEHSYSCGYSDGYNSRIDEEIAPRPADAKMTKEEILHECAIRG